jgi:hypothetical protein
MSEEKSPQEEVAPQASQGPTQAKLDAQVKQASARRTRRSFLAASAAAAAGYGFYRWIDNGEVVGRQPLPLREAFETNAEIARAVFREANLAPTYPTEKAVADLRTNGFYGLSSELVPETWRLQLVGVEDPHKYPQYSDDVTKWNYQYFVDEHSGPQAAPSDKGQPGVLITTLQVHKRGSGEAGPSANDLPPETPGLLLTMDDLRKLQHHDLVTEFKCIEGWSEIARWGGVRLADLIAAYPPAKRPDGKLPRYVYMETPDGDYYCGYDMQWALHPQSLLVYEMGGKPITRWHGAPLRLHSPLKYGYKQIKRIGLIAYTDMKPDDYWTKLGYDWYAGL